jgi:phosphoserine aminotransferase
MEIPDDYEILFTHGGGHGQFAALPLKMLTEAMRN